MACGSILLDYQHQGQPIEGKSTPPGGIPGGDIVVFTGYNRDTKVGSLGVAVINHLQMV